MRNRHPIHHACVHSVIAQGPILVFSLLIKNKRVETFIELIPPVALNLSFIFALSVIAFIDVNVWNLHLKIFLLVTNHNYHIGWSDKYGFHQWTFFLLLKYPFHKAITSKVWINISINNLDIKLQKYRSEVLYYWAKYRRKSTQRHLIQIFDTINDL